jgi:hypothetical protein
VRDWLLMAVVVLAFAVLVAPDWLRWPLLLVGLLLVLTWGLLMARQRRKAGLDPGLDPLLREGPLRGKPIGDDSERAVHTVDQFAGLARTEAMVEFGEAMAQERLRAQTQAERDLRN